MNVTALNEWSSALLRVRSGHWAGVRLTGRMTVSPFAGSLYRQELGMMPLQDAAEFCHSRFFEKIGQSPILLSPTQRNSLLARLVQVARTIPQFRVALVQGGGPDFQRPLPAELLAAEVLLISDPEPLARRVLDQGECGVMTISHRLRVDGFEIGDNSLEIGFYGAGLLEPFLTAIHDAGVLQWIEGLSVTLVEAAGMPSRRGSGLPAEAVVARALRSSSGEGNAKTPVETGAEGGIAIRAASYWRILPPFLPQRAELTEKIDSLGRCIGVQVDHLCRDIGEPIDYLLCSTHLSLSVSMNSQRSAQFLDAIERHCGRRPLGIIQTYECVGWGYALRFLARHARSRLALVSIVDIDFHGFNWYAYNPAVGVSGFGVTTLLVDLDSCCAESVMTDGPYPNSAFKEFIRSVRGYHVEMGRRPTFIPFLREDLGQVAERLIGKDVLTPNRNAELGHCMGSDPWIGLIDWVRNERPRRHQTVLACAFAYNGYYTIAPVVVDAGTFVDMQTIDGHDDRFLPMVTALAADPEYRRPRAPVTALLEC